MRDIFTSSTPSQEWAHSTVVTTPAVGYVADLKEQSGAEVGIHGSIALAQSLLRARLVDELRLVIAPAIAGRGRRLFDGEDAVQKLDLIDFDRAPSGALLLHYRVDARRDAAA